MTSDETVTASTPKSSMMLGRATASIVELSGTSTEPLATPSIAGPMQPRPTRPGHRRRTIPVLPSSSTSRPSAIRCVASPVPTTAGRANSRATTAACDRTPPVLVIEPAGDREERHPGRVRRGAHDDVARLDRPEIVLVAGHPGTSADDPGGGAGAAQLVRLGRLEPLAIEAVAARRPPTAPRSCAAAGSPPNGPAPRGGRRRPAGDPRVAGAAPGSRRVADRTCRRRRSITPAAASRPADPHDEAAQGRLRHPVDPVVVDLGQRADLAREPEERLEARRAALDRRPARARTPAARTSASAACRSRRSSAPTVGGYSTRLASSVRSRSGSSAHDGMARSSKPWPRWPCVGQECVEARP